MRIVIDQRFMLRIGTNARSKQRSGKDWYKDAQFLMRFIAGLFEQRQSVENLGQLLSKIYI